VTLIPTATSLKPALSYATTHSTTYNPQALSPASCGLLLFDEGDKYLPDHHRDALRACLLGLTRRAIELN
jgi:hypothetical protein